MLCHCHRSEGGILPFLGGDEHVPVQPAQAVWPRPFPPPSLTRHFQRAGQTSQSGNSRICALMVMTHNKRAQAAIPHQDKRNLSCLAWFSSPRGTTCNTIFRRDMKPIRRIGHGSARSIESLRGLWLPLVSGPNTKQCLLQGMQNETERVSIGSEPQAPGTAVRQTAGQSLGGG